MFVIDLHKERHTESLQNAFTIVCSSIDPSKYSALITSGTQTLDVLWMTTWPKSEVKQKFPEISNLDARYDRHGGVLRYLLWPEEKAIEDLDGVLDSTGTNMFLSALRPDCNDSTISGRLVHYTEVDSRFKKPVAKFASLSIRNRVYTRFVFKERLGLKVATDAMKFDTGFSNPRGVLLELAWHHEIRTGGDWTLEDLETGGTKLVTVAPFTGEVVTCKDDMRDLTTLDVGAYVAPIKENLALLDFFTVAHDIWSISEDASEADSPSASDNTVGTGSPSASGNTAGTDAPSANGDTTGTNVSLASSGVDETDSPLESGDVDETIAPLSIFGFQMASSQLGNRPVKSKHTIVGIDFVKKLHPVDSVYIVFIADSTDLSKWTKQSFKTDEGVKYTSTGIPKALKDVKQYVLGIPNLKARLANNEQS